MDQSTDIKYTDEKNSSSSPQVRPTDAKVPNSSLTLPERLIHLAHVASSSSSSNSHSFQFQHQHLPSIQGYLDAIESLLEPRSELTLTDKVTLRQPGAVVSTATAPPASQTTPSMASSNSITASGIESQLAALLEQINIIDRDLKKRCTETFHIYELFRLKCQGLTQRLSELENDVYHL